MRPEERGCLSQIMKELRKVDTIPGLEAGGAFCFYLVELEGSHIKEPIWFE